ncbi:MAG: serine/threonine-protein kinase, partial [Actinomycetota bacterium]
MDEAVDFMEREDASPAQDQLGSKYLLGTTIGRGAMGVVHEATTREGQSLAVKILRPELSSDTKTVSRFIQERQIFSRVEHPNVVRVHDLVAEGDRLGIVMERVSGGDLRQRVEAGTLTPSQSVAIGLDIASGLQAIHDVDVIHRDLKPANILVATGPDGEPMPKISDFGISRLVNEAMTRTSTTIGTPLYMAPESAD